MSTLRLRILVHTKSFLGELEERQQNSWRKAQKRTEEQVGRRGSGALAPGWCPSTWGRKPVQGIKLTCSGRCNGACLSSELLRTLRQKEHKFEPGLANLARLCLEIKTTRAGDVAKFYHV